MELAAHEKLGIKNKYGIQTDFVKVVCGSCTVRIGLFKTLAMSDARGYSHSSWFRRWRLKVKAKVRVKVTEIEVSLPTRTVD